MQAVPPADSRSGEVGHGDVAAIRGGDLDLREPDAPVQVPGLGAAPSWNRSLHGHPQESSRKIERVVDNDLSGPERLVWNAFPRGTWVDLRAMTQRPMTCRVPDRGTPRARYGPKWSPPCCSARALTSRVALRPFAFAAHGLAGGWT